MEKIIMKKDYLIYLIITLIICSAGCAPSYKARPLSFKHPSAYPNTTQVADAIIGSRAFVDKKEAQEAFGFDVRSAGMLPVQIVADNQGQKGLYIVANQTFLQDKEGNLWPVLTDKFAYERVTKYAQTKEIFKEGAYAGVMSATAGALIGAAIGIVTGENVASAAGKGAAIGAAAGGTAGGLKGYDSAYQARREVMEDFEGKSLKNKSLSPNNLSYGFIFFPGEAKSAKLLRLQLKEEDSNRIFTINLKFE
jgi:hypothetical protein